MYNPSIYTVYLYIVYSSDPCPQSPNRSLVRFFFRRLLQFVTR